MPSFSRNDVVPIRYVFSDLSGSKVRPAVVANAPHSSQDIFLVPPTSRIAGLLEGEFMLSHWKAAGLNVPSSVKRGIYRCGDSLVAKALGQLSSDGAQ